MLYNCHSFWFSHWFHTGSQPASRVSLLPLRHSKTEPKQTAIAALAPACPSSCLPSLTWWGTCSLVSPPSSLLCGAHSLQGETQMSHKFSVWGQKGEGWQEQGATGQVLWKQKLGFKRTPFWVFVLLINHHAHCYLGNSFFKIRGFN